MRAMLALRMVVVEGDAAPQAQASFGPSGGTIGRADHNTLVLSDPERSVSRLHARVEWRDGRFLLVNMGINPIVSQGSMLSTADEAPLADGDMLRIGRFVLRVERVDSLVDPVLEKDREAVFDDMTGLPLPRKPGLATVPVDISMFDLRSMTAPAPPRAAQPATPWPADPEPEAWLAELLLGMGCAVPTGLAAMTAHEAGERLRVALDAAWRTGFPEASPQARQAWFAAFEAALARVCRAGAGGRPPVP